MILAPNHWHTLHFALILGRLYQWITYIMFWRCIDTGKDYKILETTHKSSCGGYLAFCSLQTIHFKQDIIDLRYFKIRISMLKSVIYVNKTSTRIYGSIWLFSLPCFWFYFEKERLTYKWSVFYFIKTNELHCSYNEVFDKVNGGKSGENHDTKTTALVL